MKLYNSAILIIFLLTGCATSDRYSWDPLINKEGEIVKKEIKIDKEKIASLKMTVFYDEEYTASWVIYPQYLIKYLEKKGFTKINAVELEEWMKHHAEKEDAYGTVCVMSMGIVPRNIVTPRNKQCILYKYLKSGGRIVWLGDYPLWIIGTPGGYTESFGDEIAWDILDITGGRLVDYETSEELTLTTPAKSASITEEGKKWGMQIIDNAHSFYFTINVTKAFSDVHPLYCCSWIKTYNSNYPNSGFIKYRSTLYDGRDEKLNEDVYRIATYQLLEKKEK